MHPKAPGEMESDTFSDRFQAIIHKQSDGLVVMSRERQVLYMNPAARRFLGGMGVQEGATLQVLDFEPGKTIETDLPLAGETHTFSVHAVESRWDDQDSIVLTLKDITERKQEEALVQQALDMAEKRAAELEAIRFVADQLNQAAMFEEAIQSGLETILALIPARAVWVLLPEGDGRTSLVVIYPQGSLLKSEKRSLPSFSCASLQEVFAGKQQGAAYRSDPECVRQLGISGALPERFVCVPLGRKERPLGALNVSLDAGQELSEGELKLLETIGSQLSVAIERALPFSDSQEALRREENLKRVSRAISGAIDLPTLLQNTVQIAIDMARADAASLGLLTPNEQHLTFLTHYPENLTQPSLSRSEDIIWKTLQSTRAALLSGADLKELPPGFAEGAQHMILAPILAGGKSLGVLCVYNTSPDKALNAFDRALVESLGQQAGLAVQNAQLFFEVQQLTMTDSLTGLYNQSSFNSFAVREVERAWRYRRPLTLLMLDIDGLELINRQYGAAGGDAALRTVAQCLQDGLRRVDILSRHEMDTFLMLLPETELARGVEVAERLRASVEKAIVVGEDFQFSLTASVGVAGLSSQEVIDLDTLIDRARQALETARAGGRRNTVGCWTD